MALWSHVRVVVVTHLGPPPYPDPSTPNPDPDGYMLSRDGTEPCDHVIWGWRGLCADKRPCSRGFAAGRGAVDDPGTPGVHPSGGGQHRRNKVGAHAQQNFLLGQLNFNGHFSCFGK